MSIKIEQSKYEAVDPGIYPATISSIAEEDGKFGPQIKFIFTFEADGGEERTLIGWTSKRFSKKSKLYAWTTSLLGAVPDDYAFDSDDLLGKQVLLVVGQRYGADGMTLFNSIESIKPINKKPQAVQQAEFIEAEAPA